MPRRKKAPKTKRLVVLISPHEHARLRQEHSKTTYRVFSDYVRSLLSRNTRILRCRNTSLDEFLPVAIGIKNELAAIAKNYSAAIKALQAPSLGQDARQALDFLLAEDFALRQ